MSKRSKARKLRKEQDKDTFRVQRFAEESRLRRERAAATGDLRYLLPSVRQHYHVLFNAMPNYAVGYETPTMAMRTIGAMLDKLELVEGRGQNGYTVYEEGHVLLRGITLPDRTGRHDVFVQVGECVDARCRNIQKLESHAFREGELGKAVSEI